MEILISFFSRGGWRAFFDSAEFAWVAEIESRSLAIRRELEVLLRDRRRIPNFHDVSDDQAVLASGEEWKTYFLYAGGNRVTENCAACPETARVLAEIPQMQTAMFSILAPRYHIPPHRGLYKGVLRYHLGLIIPEPENSCRIRVRDEVRSWQFGKSLIFDDTYQHEVWNDSDAQRVILFVDFVRPLPFPLSVLNEAVIRRFSKSAFVENAMKRIRETSLAAADDAEALK